MESAVGGTAGVHRWAVLLGIVTIAQNLDLDVQGYLAWMFERRGTRKAPWPQRVSEPRTPAIEPQWGQHRGRTASIGWACAGNGRSSGAGLRAYTIGSTFAAP